VTALTTKRHEGDARETEGEVTDLSRGVWNDPDKQGYLNSRVKAHYDAKKDVTRIDNQCLSEVQPRTGTDYWVSLCHLHPYLPLENCAGVSRREANTITY